MIYAKVDFYFENILKSDKMLKESGVLKFYT